MNQTYHATPYDLSASGFFFSSYEDYTAQAATHRNAFGQPVEEYEIQFIDGENSALFAALGICQATLSLWFEAFEQLSMHEAIKAIYLATDLNTPIDRILDRLDDVMLFEGTSVEYAREYIEETGMLDPLPESLRWYFDTEAFARDLVLAGDISEHEIEGQCWVIQGG